MKNYYQLLEIAATASQDEIKRAFRQQIARYHPDKVQHLGKEFQAMAADRAAELTEAYRILSDEGRRSEYDKARASAAPPAAETPARAAPEGAGAPRATPVAEPPPADPQPAQARGDSFKEERATRDEYVRKATLSRFRDALSAVAGDSYDQSQVRGFDFGCVPKATLFSRGKGPRLLGRFVDRVDAPAITDTFARAAQAGASSDEVCVFLMGSGMAPRRELEAAIFQQRRRTGSGPKVTLIPLDSRDWDAHVPVDAPPIVKKLLTRLRTGQ